MTKITINRSTVEQALAALEDKRDKVTGLMQVEDAITALRAALAEPVQEPVAQAMQDAVVYGMGIFHGGKRIDPDSIYKKAEPVQEPVQEPVATLYGTLPIYDTAPQPAEPVQEPVQGPVCRDDGMPTSAEERHLRRLLALRAAMPHTYCDDGEAQGTEHGISIDFMREPVAHLDAKLRALNVARAIAKQAEPVQEPKPVAWDGTCVLGYCSSPTGCENSGECRAVERAHGIGGEG